VVVIAGCNSDPYCGIQPDIGKRMHEIGRPATWHATHMTIENNKFDIAVGPVVYQDDKDTLNDFYSIHIAITHGVLWHIINEGSILRASYVIYQRDFKIDELPVGIIGLSASEIVEYNKRKRSVLFKLGDNSCNYSLPAR